MYRQISGAIVSMTTRGRVYRQISGAIVPVVILDLRACGFCSFPFSEKKIFLFRFFFLIFCSEVCLSFHSTQIFRRFCTRSKRDLLTASTPTVRTPSTESSVFFLRVQKLPFASKKNKRHDVTDETTWRWCHC